MSDLFDDLERQGFTPNIGLAANLEPGDVIQVADGQGRFARPMIFLRKDDRFPLYPTRDSPYSGRPGERPACRLVDPFRQGLGAQRAEFWIQRDRHQGAWSLQVEAPKIVNFSKAELSEHFSASCVAAFGRVLAAGEDEAWYEVVLETVVADSLKLTIEWSFGRHGRGANTPDIGCSDWAAQAKSGTIATTPDSSEATVLLSAGPVVLAFRSRPIRAVRAEHQAP